MYGSPATKVKFCATAPEQNSTKPAIVYWFEIYFFFLLGGGEGDAFFILGLNNHGSINNRIINTSYGRFNFDNDLH